ncbi:MAG: hypothetical protein AB7R89_12860 [Dehalococcoidia bacterium]
MRDLTRRVLAIAPAFVLIAVIAGAAPSLNVARSRSSGSQCGASDTMPLPSAMHVQISIPHPEARLTNPAIVAGSAFGFGLGTGIAITLRDAAGGTLTESVIDPEPGDGRSSFAASLPYVVGEDTLACLWVYTIPPSNASLPEPQLAALIPVTLAPADGPPATMGRPAPYFENNTGAALIAAAKAYVAEQSDVPVVDAHIVRVVRNWAAVRLFPPPDLTDPATVILRRNQPADSAATIDAGWTGVTFGTAGLCDDDETPPILCDFQRPYIGESATFAEATIDARTGRQTYQGRGFTFDYPADGRVFEPPLDPFSARIQRFIPDAGTFVYDIHLQPTLPGAGTVDQWAYTRMVAGTSDLSTCPVTATYFETEANAVFQVDCVTGSAIERRFYVTARDATDGLAALVTVTIPPEGVNPWQPDADTALTLLLNTLQLAHDREDAP